MIAVVTPGPGGFVVRLFGDDGSPAGDADSLASDACSLAGDAASASARAAGAGPDALSGDGEPVAGAALVADVEARLAPRWIFDSVAEQYLPLVRAGVRVRRCHDIALTERILLGRAGRFGEPCRAAAVLARADGREVPADPEPSSPIAAAGASQPGLFDAGFLDAGLLEAVPSDSDFVDSGSADAAAARATEYKRPEDLVRAYLDQRRRVASLATGALPDAVGRAVVEVGGATSRLVDPAVTVDPGALRLLIAAESGSALVAAEMTHRGLPWDAAAHERILVDKLGPRPPGGARPARMAALAEQIAEAFGFPVNPDSAVDLRHAFQRAGFDIESTRAWILRELDHPAVEFVLAYKDLARLYTANGWHWLERWVADGRLVSEYLPGAVVSGRWATRGGGGLQLPKAIRAAAVAQPGHVLVVADAAQLEPRVWAAVSGDRGLAAAASNDDMYTALAAAGFGGDRRHAKLAMLGGMYGQTSGEAARLMATMRVQYPVAVGYVEAAARRGEAGGVVRSVLGRCAPPPSDGWWRAVGGSSSAEDEARARRVARDRGRFTRNFVIQASAADWAAVWMTLLRERLWDVPGAEIVFFQHDEIVVHAPSASADAVSAAVVEAAERARDLVFPGSTVRLPVRPEAVRCYADAK